MQYLTTPGRDIVPGRFNLVVHCRANARWYSAHFATLEELANAVREHLARWYPAAFRGKYGGVDNLFDFPLTYGPRGGALDTRAVVALGRRLRASWVPRWYAKTWGHAGYVRRSGPVHGIHKPRNYTQFRSIATMAERRLAGLVVREDGEVAPRPARSPRCLPDDRDDYSRCNERSWKVQGKRRKAWDR
jgi:hypothetical protein